MNQVRTAQSRQDHLFIGYLTAGYPDREKSIQIMKKCCESGLDVLELGFPAQNASLDGEVIRKAQEHADKTLHADISYWREVREAIDVPIWLMGYRQDLEDHDIFLTLAKENLYDVLVLPDISQDERSSLQQLLRPYDVTVLWFINSEMKKEEIDRALKESEIIYHQLYCGPTGVSHNDSSYLSLLHYARANSSAKIFAGFGISSQERVLELLYNGYDGTIIGSSIMKLVEEDEESAYQFIRSIHDTVRSVA